MKRFNKKRKPTMAESEHYAKVAQLGCIIRNGDCGGKLELHHPTGAGMALKASNMEVVPLCFNHHSAQTPLKFGHSVHKGTKTVESIYGTQKELLAKTLELLEAYDN